MSSWSRLTAPKEASTPAITPTPWRLFDACAAAGLRVRPDLASGARNCPDGKRQAEKEEASACAELLPELLCRRSCIEATFAPVPRFRIGAVRLHEGRRRGAVQLRFPFPNPRTGGFQGAPGPQGGIYHVDTLLPLRGVRRRHAVVAVGRGGPGSGESRLAALQRRPGNGADHCVAEGCQLHLLFG